MLFKQHLIKHWVLTQTTVWLQGGQQLVTGAINNLPQRDLSSSLSYLSVKSSSWTGLPSLMYVIQLSWEQKQIHSWVITGSNAFHLKMWSYGFHIHVFRLYNALNAKMWSCVYIETLICVSLHAYIYICMFALAYVIRIHYQSYKSVNVMSLTFY